MFRCRQLELSSLIIFLIGLSKIIADGSRRERRGFQLSADDYRFLYFSMIT